MKSPFFLTCLLWVALVSGTQAQYKLYKGGTDSYNSGDYDAAITQLHDYLSRWSHDKTHDDEIYYMLGVSYFKKSDFSNSMKEFDAAQRTNPNSLRNGSISWHLALCCEKLNQLKEAVAEYGNTIKIYENDSKNCSKLLTERAKVQIKLEEIPLAKTDLSQALLLDPQNKEAKAALDNLNSTVVVSSRDVTQPPEKKTTDKKTTEKKFNLRQPIVDEKKVDEKKIVAENKPAVVVDPEKILTLKEMYSDEKRYALVIGNSNYPSSIGMLPNPKNDATDIAAVLKKSGFQVDLLVDATYGEIKNGVYEMKKLLDQSDREKTVALFYYAGHGIQAMNDNWLIPVDSKFLIKDEDDIRRLCVPVQSLVLNNLLYSNTRMNIIILDACRNNPFPASTRSAGGKGLQEVSKARGSFIAFATAPGSVASDGKGRNGLYTQELLKAMSKPGLTIEQVFKEVRKNVLQLSGGTQDTWDNSNIIGDFYFNVNAKK